MDSKWTKRDAFALAAMQALITHEHSPEQNGKEVVTITDICTDAYNYADAMMIAREVKPETKKK